MEYRSFRMETLFAGIGLPRSDGQETSSNGDDSQGRTHEARHWANGLTSAEASAKDARPSPHQVAGTDASLAAAGSSPDDFQSAVAAALTASSRLLALSTTPTVLTAENVQCLDQLFAASPEEGTSFVLPRPKRNPWDFGTDPVL